MDLIESLEGLKKQEKSLRAKIRISVKALGEAEGVCRAISRRGDGLLDTLLEVQLKIHNRSMGVSDE